MIASPVMVAQPHIIPFSKGISYDETLADIVLVLANGHNGQLLPFRHISGNKEDLRGVTKWALLETVDGNKRTHLQNVNDLYPYPGRR